MHSINSAGENARAEGGEETVRTGRHEHHKTITMADIAKAAGVSQGAISSLLNDRDYGIRVSPLTRDRVFKACRELGYIPNDLRAVVRMYPERGEFAVLAAAGHQLGFGEPFLSRIVLGVMNTIGDPSRAVTLARYKAGLDYHLAAQELPEPVRSGTASKFICVGKADLSLFQAIIKRGFPAISIGHDLPLPGVTSIVTDYTEASRLAVEYLFKLGHQQIAILSGPFGTTAPQIIEMNRGVRLAFDAAAVPIEAQNIIYGDLTFQNGFKSAETLCNRLPQLSAILCFNDSAATGVLAYLQNRGVKVPGQISVLGCSDDAFVECVHPALTTVHLPAEEMGAAAVQEIERRVLEKEEGLVHVKKMLLPVRLVERASCAAPAKA